MRNDLEAMEGVGKSDVDRTKGTLESHLAIELLH